MKVSPKLLQILISTAVCSALLLLAYFLQSYFNLSQAFMKFAASLMLLLVMSSALFLKYKSMPLPLKRSLIAFCISFSILTILFGIKVFYMDINIPFYLVVVLLLGPALLNMLLERSHRK